MKLGTIFELTTTIALTVFVQEFPPVTVTVYVPAVVIAEVVAVFPKPDDHA